MKPRHVYRPPRKNRFLSTAIIGTGGLLFTFLVFYLIPLMRKLESGLTDQNSDLVANISVAPEEEYVEPEQEEEEEEPEPEPELMEEEEQIAIEALDLPDLGGGATGKIILSLNSSVAMNQTDLDEGMMDQEPVAVTSFDPSLTSAIKKKLQKRKKVVKVIVSALVSEKGSVIEASVSRSSGIPALDQAAVKAVRGWKFKPAIKGGRKAKARIKQPFTFRPPN